MARINKIEISVIMSVFNESIEYLQLSIWSILNQSFKDFEFIIVCDNPKREDIKEFLNKLNDSRIVLIFNKKNIGLTKSLNKALDKAKGKYVARMDADDISLKSRLMTQFNYLEKNQKIFLVGTSIYKINFEGKRIKKLNVITSDKKINNLLRKRNVLNHPTIMWRNNTNIRYREKFKYAQDYDFYLNLISNNYRLSNINEPLLEYRMGDKSISFNNYLEQRFYAQKARFFLKQRDSKKFDSYYRDDLVYVQKNSLELLEYQILYFFSIGEFLKGSNKLIIYIKSNKSLIDKSKIFFKSILRYLFYLILDLQNKNKK